MPVPTVSHVWVNFAITATSFVFLAASVESVDMDLAVGHFFLKVNAYFNLLFQQGFLIAILANFCFKVSMCDVIGFLLFFFIQL
jgi:hypothetical protein